jgi:hypothetical protein
MIPEAWEAHVDTGEFLPSLGHTHVCRIFGDSREEALELARADFPNLEE